jgi:hypothetical protein
MNVRVADWRKHGGVRRHGSGVETEVSRGEAFDRLEHSAGPHARKMLERILEQVKELEAKYLEEKSTD